jgi:hypothetical protein
MVLKFRAEKLLLTNLLKGPTEEVISEAETTTAEGEAETGGIITGRKHKTQKL